jgi:hypothetical protein
MLTTFVARASDGLLLSENYEGSEQIQDSRRKIMALLKSGSAREETKEMVVLEIMSVHNLW